MLGHVHVQCVCVSPSALWHALTSTRADDVWWFSNTLGVCITAIWIVHVQWSCH
jgi:hypothetical protein